METAQATPLTLALMEELQTAFAAMNALEFARYLHTLAIPDAVKSEWLKCKVMLKPSEQENAMQNAVARAMDKWWTQFATERK
jgi:hypothetical protein